MSVAEQTTDETGVYPLPDDIFRRLQEIVISNTGIQITDDKRDLLVNRLQRRIRKLKLGGFSDYYELVSQPNNAEFEEFINAVTTNLTSFFRENHHLEHLANVALPEFSRNVANNRRLRIWSAGCSSGEEPYSIAMVLREQEALFQAWDSKILATDLDSQVLSKAAAGVYAENTVLAMNNPTRKEKWFTPAAQQGGSYAVKPELQQLISFRKLNLLKDWPFKGRFNAIFCRNVLIYFDKPTQKKVVENFGRYLTDDGYLYVGHSESLNRVTEMYERVGNTIYRKIK